MSASFREHEAREAKARRIAAVLRAANCTADDAEVLHPDARRLAITIAGYDGASDLTWRLVVSRLRRPDPAQLMAEARPADTFQGLPS